MKYKVYNCSSFEGIRLKGKDSKIKMIFEMLKLVNMYDCMDTYKIRTVDSVHKI